MDTVTLTLKVSNRFASAFRKFCDAHFLQIGKFTEHALTEAGDHPILDSRADGG